MNQEEAAVMGAGFLATGSGMEGMWLEEGHIGDDCHPAWEEDPVQGEEHGWVVGVPA